MTRSIARCTDRCQTRTNFTTINGNAIFDNENQRRVSDHAFVPR